MRTGRLESMGHVSTAASARPGRVRAWLDRVGRYAQEVRTEARKVIWPTPRQTVVFTVVVIVTVAIVAAFIAGVDAILSWALGLLLGAPGSP